ncbi:MAG: PDZ domain-containing protein [Henriciella sp.]|jgi:carboxyl-terminal processing protease
MGNRDLRLIGALLAVGLLGACQPEDVPNADPGPDTVAGLADVEAVCSIVSDKYAYFETREDNWGAACDQAKASIANAETSTDRLLVIETLLDALYDPHISLNTNSGRSPRLVPSGADYWVELGEVVSVRQGGSAAGAGLTVGDRILDIDGRQMTEAAIERVQPEGVNASAAQLDWAL